MRGGSLIALLLVWHLPRAGGNGWGGEELLISPSSMLFISTLLHIVGENELLAYVEIRVWHRHTHIHGSWFWAPGGCWHPGMA